jgi:hypothetical protein
MNGKNERSKGKYSKIILQGKGRKIDYKKKKEKKRRAKKDFKNL